MTKWILRALAAAVIAAAILVYLTQAHAAEPITTTYEAQWSRTCVPGAAYVHTFTSTEAGIVVDADGNEVLFTLPAQVKLVCTSTAVITPCWSQDPASTFDSPGYFDADADGVYSAGHGICDAVTAPEGWTGIPSSAQFHDGGTALPGARNMTCASTREPCAADGECTIGNCTQNKKPRTTYLYLRSDFIWPAATDGRPNRCAVVDCR